MTTSPGYDLLGSDVVRPAVINHLIARKFVKHLDIPEFTKLARHVLESATPEQVYEENGGFTHVFTSKGFLDPKTVYITICIYTDSKELRQDSVVVPVVTSKMGIEGGDGDVAYCSGCETDSGVELYDSSDDSDDSDDDDYDGGSDNEDGSEDGDNVNALY